MNRMPRVTARVANEVTGIPTTPNMCVTPARARALATRRLQSIVAVFGVDSAIGEVRIE
ncbi:hypothetical protein Hanom_Chr07g00646531 [Helianthus anomalus]